MKLKIIPAVAVLLFGIFVTSAFAASDRAAAVRKNSTASAGFNASPSASPLVRGKSNLTAVKLKVCQTKVNGITKRLDQLNRFATNMEGKFDAIATRVESFYTTKVEPTKPLSNYAALVAEIDTQKGLVTTALTKAQTDSAGFSCETGDPKGLLRQYRLDMQAVKKALGAYRTSIKNLIVAVHTQVGDEETSETNEGASGSPLATAVSSASPSATPVASATPTPVASPTESPTPTPIASPI